MTELVLAAGAFVVAHLVPALGPLRAALVRVLGERGYLALYSLLSPAVIVWMIRAYAGAPTVELWAPAPLARWLAVAAMPVACVLAVAGLASPNPFSLGWGRRPFDAGRPGIVGLCRHPVIWALSLWAGVHILANGDVRSLILFGLLLGLSLAGPKSLDAKRRRTLGPDAWRALAAEAARTGAVEALRQTGPWRVLGGLVLYAVLLLAHETVIGVAPLGG